MRVAFISETNPYLRKTKLLFVALKLLIVFPKLLIVFLFLNPIKLAT